MVQTYILKTEGLKPVSIACPKCVPGKKVHRVLACVAENGSDSDGPHSCDWTNTFELVQCCGCETVSFRATSTHSEAVEYDHRGEPYYPLDQKLYPPRIEGRKDLGGDAWCIPHNIKSVYEEVLTALACQSPVLVGMGLRALIEAVCKEKEAPGHDLHKRIEWLKEKQVLTESGAQILHHIRTLGNGAAHEIKPHSMEELELALDVVEHLFKEVYILPFEAKRVFEGKRTALPQGFLVPLPPPATP
jgi:hypothetical protein